MKILFLNNQKKYRGSGEGYNRQWGWELFREELGRRADILFCGWGYNPEWKKRNKLSGIIKRFGKPDVILSHCNLDHYNDYNEITDVLKVHIAEDYYEGCWKLPRLKKHLQKYKFDIVFGYSSFVVKQLEKDQIGKKQFLLPFAVDPYIFRNLKLTKKYDVAAFYCTEPPDIFPFRHKIRKMIKDMGISTWTEKVYYDDAVIKMNQARICINSNARFKFVNPRVTEVLSCGTFLLTDRTKELVDFGYIDGYHLVMFDNLVDLKDKIIYFLKHEDEREEIAINGQKFVRENYTNECTVRILLSTLSPELVNVEQNIK